MKPFENPAVEAIFAAYPAKIRPKLMALREAIFSTAAATEGVGELEETLRWGEPAYVTTKTGSGSPIRIAETCIQCRRLGRSKSGLFLWRLVLEQNRWPRRQSQPSTCRRTCMLSKAIFVLATSSEGHRGHPKELGPERYRAGHSSYVLRVLFLRDRLGGLFQESVPRFPWLYSFPNLSIHGVSYSLCLVILLSG